MKRILLVDDEPKILKIFHSSLTKKGYDVQTAANGQEARNKILEHDPELVFLDLKLPDTSGLELLEEFRGMYPNKIYIMMTAYGNVENAVAAMKVGAFDYIIKPIKLNELLIIIQKAMDWLLVNEENQSLKEKLHRMETSNELLGVSSIMKRIYQLVQRVAPTDASVLLQGESGTGKSKVAQMIHEQSERRNAPFVPVNCASIPEQLLESELFGHEKGSFTGATSTRKGKFEAANGGTIFLDEIGEISTAFQAKLLQVTQDKSFMRVGSDKLQTVDVRIITATNKNLKELVNLKEFREDLFYRLNIVDIYIPPLRERSDDIPMLVESFLEYHRQKHGKNFQASTKLINLLMDYHWPGNVRELQNAIERAVVLCPGDQLSIDDFPQEISERKETTTVSKSSSLPERIADVEKKMILEALDEGLGQPAAAAKRLGISRQSLLYKMNKHFSENK